MAIQQMLYDSLTTIQAQNKTGRLFLFCKNDQNRVTKRPGELHVNQGKIVAIIAAGQNGQSALNVLMDQPIERVLFMEEQSSNGANDPTLPTIENILQQAAEQTSQ